MNWDRWLPVLVVSSSLIPGIVIFLLREEQKTLRTILNLAGAILKIIFVAMMLWGVSQNHEYVIRYPLLAGIDLALHADPFSLLFVSLSAVLWLLTTIYAIGYLEGSPNRGRFFGFFSLCVSATTGIALAANLLTFLIFYETLTLTTYPLIAHRGTRAALRGARMYLMFAVSAGAVLLLAVIWLQSITGALEFTEGGFLSAVDPQHYDALRIVFCLMIIGFGVKAALFPLHAWLPEAMVAPAPVSALLHAVAVVKAGAFGIVRVVYDVYGVEFCSQLGVATPLAIAASVTILYASLRAVYQDDLKRRLAFSTVSQVSYIILGTAVVGPLATTGGIVHLVHQGLMKITLFFAAGNLAETLGIHKISQLNGVAKRMPATMAAFTIAALGMIGIPPTAGFITKWYLGSGALEAGQPWVIGVLVGSTVLNAVYFLPIIYAAWFRSPNELCEWEHERVAGQAETRLSLLVPPLITAALTLLVGLLANMPFSPMQWVKFIVAREYQP
jgi:multicomponent Na+:H+ antiporter subunit D